MLATTMCCALRGVTGTPVTVEADVANGLPTFTVVGLTDRAIQEARERVRAAIRNGGYEFPARRLTVNLAPAEVPKEGTGFDLAIAVAILRAHEGFAIERTAFIGELALDGSLRPVVGVLPMARSLAAAGIRRLIVAPGNGEEAAMVHGLDVAIAHTLTACIEDLRGAASLDRVTARSEPVPAEKRPSKWQAVRGQVVAKRALEVAAAGSHNVLMIGPPGSGKTMLAEAFSDLLPDLDADASLEIAAVYSLRGALHERRPTSVRPPFRAPHHTVSRAGLIGGGGTSVLPGEISLAHRGVLFLDEVCEFPRRHLDGLRQPLEAGCVAISRARHCVTLPARFLLIAAANPCPCGHAGDTRGRCRCHSRAVREYQARLSGPIRDRIDLVISVPRQTLADLDPRRSIADDVKAVQARVAAARCFRQARGDVVPGVFPDPAGFRDDARCLLHRAGESLRLSARGYVRVSAVARTIADIAGSDAVDVDAVSEALAYRADAFAAVGGGQ